MSPMVSAIADLPFLVPVVAVLVAVLFVAAVVWSMYKVAEPNEALIISGLGARGDTGGDRRPDSLGFKIVSGTGTLVLPVVQTVRSLSLDMRQISINLQALTGGEAKQSIPVHVEAVVQFKVADDYASIANAARRFLGKQKEMDAAVEQLAHGQLRVIIGEMTVEELIADRKKLRTLVLESVQQEMNTLGLHVDSFQIQKIVDVPSRDEQPGYIENLGRPQAATVARDARIAEAERVREATEREQDAKARVAEATKASDVRQAQALAETDQARSKAEQAGPLAEATARQEVIEANTRAAELEASLTERRLQAEVRKPADARAYEQVTLAEAARQEEVKRAEAEAQRVKLEAQAAAESTKVKGDAEAHATQVTGDADATAIKARGLAEADGIRARNEALAENSEAVIAEKVAGQLPDIVRAAAAQWENVDNLTVLNGGEGLTKMVADTIGSAGTLLPAAKHLISGAQEMDGGNGGSGADAEPERNGAAGEAETAGAAAQAS
jgi:flotillin